MMRLRSICLICSLLLAACGGPGGPSEPPAEIAESIGAELSPAEVIATDAGPRRPRPTRREDIPASESVAAPETGVALGWGWRRTQGEAVPTICVTFALAQDAGQTVALDFSEVQDSFELARSLDMSAEASVKGIGYEVSGEAKFARNTRVKSSETTFVIEAEVLNPAFYAAPPETAAGVRLTPEAVALARRNDGLTAFKQACGDGYVSALTTGAKFIAVVAVKTRSLQERETLQAKVEGGGWGVKVNAAMNSESSTARDNMQRRISVHQSGGAPAPIPMEPEEIVAHARGLATLADAGGKLFRLAVTPYQTLGNWPADKDLTASSMEFEQLADLWGAYSAVYAEVDAALARPAAYSVPVRVCMPGADDCTGDEFKDLTNPTARAIAEAVQDEALAALERLNVEAQRCVVAAEECDFDERRFRAPYALRVRAPVLSCLVNPEARPADAQAAVCTAPTDWHEAVNRYADVMLRTPAKSRCRIDPFMLGCLSNAEIADWAARIGFASDLGAELMTVERSEVDALTLGPEPGPSMVSARWRPHPRALDEPLR